MLEIDIHPEVKTPPAWWAEINLCHIDDGSGRKNFCDPADIDPSDEDNITCPEYTGNAICSGCGAPTCPRCAQLCELWLSTQ